MASSRSFWILMSVLTDRIFNCLYRSSSIFDANDRNGFNGITSRNDLDNINVRKIGFKKKA